MFKKLFKNKKAQNTAEYALLIALVVAGVIAMQTYAQRSLQARIRDASTWMVGQTNSIGDSHQYEPYYLNSAYEVTRDTTELDTIGKRADDSTLYASNVDVIRKRNEGGFQSFEFDISTANQIK